MIGVQSIPAVMVVRLLFGEYFDVGQSQAGRNIAGIVRLAVKIRFYDTGECVFPVSPVGSEAEHAITRVEGGGRIAAFSGGGRVAVELTGIEWVGISIAINCIQFDTAIGDDTALALSSRPKAGIHTASANHCRGRFYFPAEDVQLQPPLPHSALPHSALLLSPKPWRRRSSS